MKNSWIDYIVFSLSVLLIFTITFRGAIEVPAILVPAGRLHPLILHFPIVLIILAVYRTWKNGYPGTFFLGITAVLTLVTAISGMLLYRESGAQGSTVNNHMWAGTALALCTAVWFWMEGNVRITKITQKGLLSVVLALVLATGHLGGTVTHGADFLAWPGSSKPAVSTDDPEIFSVMVQTVLNDKCIACHSADKKKGGLMLTDYQSLLDGGDSGTAFTAQDPDKSLMIQRMALPLEDEKHMPPAGKTQPSEQEVALIRAWIAAGAPESVLYSQLDPNSGLYQAVSAMMDGHKENQAHWEDLKPVSEQKIQALNNDYRTIKRVYGTSNALTVSIFPHEDYGPHMVTDLKPVQDNIVEFNGSSLALGKEELKWISDCGSLERLDLDNTPLQDEDMPFIARIKSLRQLKLYNTSISDAALEPLGSMPQLEFLYLWDTKITAPGLAALKRERPSLHINTGTGAKDFIVKSDSVEGEVPTEPPVN